MNARRAPFGLWPDMMRAALWRAATPLRVWWRGTWIYRRFLRGMLSDRIVFYPHDALPRRLEDAEALLRGRFRFAGEVVDVREGSIFDKLPPSVAWLDALNGFSWLPPLSAAGGEPARTLATNLISQWLKRNGKYGEPAWSPGVMADRLSHVFAHGRLVLNNSELMWRSKVFVALREQSRMLARIVREAPEGLDRFEAAAVVALSGACLDHSADRLELGLRLLENEVARQILPDGGHVSRSPEVLVHAYRHLTMVIDALTAIDHEVPQALRSAQDRMAPMLRFFRHGDGALALFNGGTESDPRMIAGLLARDEVRGRPFAHARHSGYYRLAAGRTTLVMDCGLEPPGAHSVHAHAGCLSFEMSAGAQRVVVNCGSPGQMHPRWETALRTTAAHSTLTLADTSSAVILPPGAARSLLGARLVDGPTDVVVRSADVANGQRIEASHDAYCATLGFRHERQLTLSSDGRTLTGADHLLPDPVEKRRKGKESLPFAVRFHIHPDVRVSPSQGGDVLLKLPNGEGWRFRAGGSSIAIEESVYLGGDTVRRTDQLVLTAAVKDSPTEVAWVFEQIVHA